MLCAWRYFPENKGLISGISACGITFGSLIFSFLSQKLVNPNDLAPEEYEYNSIKDHYYTEEVYDNVTIISFITRLGS